MQTTKKPLKDKMLAKFSTGLKGTAIIPGDKSMSHRALIFGSCAKGVTHVTNLLEGEDIMATAAALRQLGAEITKQDDKIWQIRGLGQKGGKIDFKTPKAALDMGNSGTGCRLLMGLVAGQNINATFTGDASLSTRPMARITTPLSLMGAKFKTADSGCLPIEVKGTKSGSKGISYDMPVASAQVKSAILLAGLSSKTPTTIIETHPTRDHTERMLNGFGAKLTVNKNKNGQDIIELQPKEHWQKPYLQPQNITIAADPSSASFAIVAAIITKDSEIHLPSILLNEGRIGLIITLKEMGADIKIENKKLQAGEPVGNLIVKSSKLNAVDVPKGRAASMIDEYPILSVAAAFANGTTRMMGIGEMRVKESDRIDLTARGLKASGVTIEEGKDYLYVTGQNGSVDGGAEIKTDWDHRIAMSFLIMGLASKKPISVKDASSIKTSFPSFLHLMQNLGADIAFS